MLRRRMSLLPLVAACRDAREDRAGRWRRAGRLAHSSAGRPRGRRHAATRPLSQRGDCAHQSRRVKGCAGRRAGERSSPSHRGGAGRVRRRRHAHRGQRCGGRGAWRNRRPSRGVSDARSQTDRGEGDGRSRCGRCASRNWSAGHHSHSSARVGTNDRTHRCSRWIRVFARLARAGDNRSRGRRFPCPPPSG